MPPFYFLFAECVLVINRNQSLIIKSKSIEGFLPICKGKYSDENKRVHSKAHATMKKESSFCGAIVQWLSLIHNLIELSRNSGSVQFQILLQESQRFLNALEEIFCIIVFSNHCIFCVTLIYFNKVFHLN